MVTPSKFQAKNELRPFIPLLIGQGKLARHLSYYLSSLSIPFKHWPESRNLTDPAFSALLLDVSVAWVLVSDRAIAEVCAKIHTINASVPLMHSSAATSVKNAFTLHPLQTFGPELYAEKTYEYIPFMFVSEETSELKKSILAAFPNPTFEIPDAKRALYHAYCVMMANFPQLLWSEVENDAEKVLPNPASLFAPILKQTLENFLHFGKEAVTGPLVRGDRATIENHLLALKNSSLLPLYEKFVHTFSKKPSAVKELL